MSKKDSVHQLNQLPIHIQTEEFVAEVLWWGMFEDSWWRNYLHVHSYYEVCFAFAGCGTFTINDRHHTVQAGDIFIAHPNRYHEIVSSKDEPLGIYFWAYTLEVHDTSGDVAALFDAFARTQECISQRTSTIPTIFDLLIDEVSRQEAGYEQSIHALTSKLLLETARSVTDLVSRPLVVNTNYSTVVRGTIQYLEDNYQRTILIRDIAAQVHMSERHVSRLFQQATGKTIKAYLTDIRLDVAQKLLLKRHLSIAEVAQRSGFPDTRYFSTLFRKQLGITPSDFRVQLGTRFSQ